MDLIKIGKYIASKRKSLGMTQKQLAEKLGMSDKSVSKWERGVCLPDVSVYKELCSILGISLNEFLAGEDIAQENMIQKSETNIIEVIKDNINKQKCLKVMKCILVFIFICVVCNRIYHIPFEKTTELHFACCKRQYINADSRTVCWIGWSIRI